MAGKVENEALVRRRWYGTLLKNPDTITYAVSLIIKAAVMAGRFSQKGRFLSYPQIFLRAIMSYSEVIKRPHWRMTSAQGPTLHRLTAIHWS